MARVSSPFYYQGDAGAMAGIGSSLARAIFGDPAAAAKQAQIKAEIDQRAAQAEADRAHARVYGAQADGIGIQNNGARSLPDMFASLVERPAPPPTLDGFLSPEHALPGPQETPDAAFRRGLPAVVAALAQAQGDKVDTSQTIGSLASFLGGDELARRGLIAQGHTPTDDFAIDPERADRIAWNRYEAARAQAMGVANIKAGATRYGADQSRAASEYRADTSARTSIRRAEMKASRPAASRAKAPPKPVAGPIVQDKTGRKLQWNGKAWVGIN